MRNFNDMTNEFGNTKVKAGKFTVGVVNNRNGKRVSISAALADTLGLKEKVYFIIDKETMELLISRHFPYKAAVEASASGEDGQKKIVYSAGIVETITQKFNLDFTARTSMSFDRVDIGTDEDTDIPYAIVKILPGVAGAGGDSDEGEFEN